MQEKTTRGFAKLHGEESLPTKVVTFTAKTVWKENDPETGILSKSTFMPFIKGLRGGDYDHTEKLLKFMRERKRISLSSHVKNDRGGKPYYWGGISRVNADDGAKIMVNEELLSLVNLYADGKIYIDFDMDDLIDEGLNH